MLVGGAVNFGVYVAMVNLSELAGRFPTLAVAGGSLAGLMVNFASAQRIVFRKRS
jgi:putative flippase GtrA